MTTSALLRQERILELADTFLAEVRRDLERATREGNDLPPRLRSVHERAGHATPEYRTMAVPVPEGAEGASPEVLSGSIARFARMKRPNSLLLALDALVPDEEGGNRPLLIAEARDRQGTRLFLVQPFRAGPGGVRWEEPLEGGWRDPGEEEMILDAAFYG